MTLRTVVVAILATRMAATWVPAQGVEGTLVDLARIREGAKSKRVSSFDRTGGNYDRLEEIQSGEQRTLFELPGAGMINHIWMGMVPPSPTLSRNDIVLRMYWDGSETPCVESPIGPFFGQGWDEAYDFSSLPLAASPQDGIGLVSYFVMPFAKGARVEIENESDKPIRVFAFYIDYVEFEELPARLGRFHAWYNHQLTGALPEGDNERNTLGRNITEDRNYLIAEIEGKGHFVGVNYYIHTPSALSGKCL